MIGDRGGRVMGITPLRVGMGNPKLEGVVRFATGDAARLARTDRMEGRSEV